MTQPTPPSGGADVQPTTAAPTTDPAATPAAPHQGEGQGNPPAPVTPPVPTPPANGQPKVDEPKFTQADLDRILTERMGRFEKSLGDKLSGLFGEPKPGEGKPTAEQVLAQAQEMMTKAQDRANAATVKSCVQAAKIKDDRVADVIGMIDVKTVLANVDANDQTAVDAAIKAAVDEKVTRFPEWKSTTLPGASTGNPNSGAAGAPAVSLDQFKAMGMADRVALKRRDETLYKQLVSQL